MPGEVAQKIGEGYVHVFSGCLERAVEPFKQTYNVYSAPEKLTFGALTDGTYSFDIMGTYGNRADVFVESKGYNSATGLLDAYKDFLAKAYCTSVMHARHRNDFFWFVTNVPFGSSSGRNLWSEAFLLEALRDAKPDRAAAYLGRMPIDRGHVASLSRRIAVGILTDSFIRMMGTAFTFRPGDSVWSVMKLIHGGVIPARVGSFKPLAEEVQRLNHLENPNKVKAGQRLLMPWHGMPEYGGSWD